MMTSSGRPAAMTLIEYPQVGPLDLQYHKLACGPTGDEWSTWRYSAERSLSDTAADSVAERLMSSPNLVFKAMGLPPHVYHADQQGQGGRIPWSA